MTDEHRGPRVNSAHSQGPTSRADLRYGEGDHLATRLWDAVNYPQDSDLTFDTYWTRYDRTSELRGIIDKFARDTWQDLPEVSDAASDPDRTDFEKDVEKLFQRQGLRGSPKQWFVNADRMAQLGQYAVLFLGFNDDADLDEAAPGIDDENSLNGPEDLNFVFPYDEGRIADFDIEEDPTDERFRLPTTYDIEITEGDVHKVHWSRVIHIPEGVVGNPLKGTPFAKPIFHELLNLDKIKAASGEGYWQGGYQGIVAQPPKDQDGSRISPEALQKGSSDDLAKQIREHREHYQRLIATTADVTTLGSDISSPEKHYEMQWRSISTYLDAPMSILMGNERGDMATEEDRAMYHETIGGRRNRFAEDVIFRPFIDRNIRVGTLSDPKGDPDDETSTLYDCEWEPLAEPSEKELAEIFSTRAQAWNRITGGMPSQALSPAEMRQEGNFDPNIGSEVDDDELEIDPEAVAPEVEAAVTNLHEVPLEEDGMPDALADGGEPTED